MAGEKGYFCYFSNPTDSAMLLDFAREFRFFLFLAK